MMQSKIGTIYLVASDLGLRTLSFKEQLIPTLQSSNNSSQKEEIICLASRQLEEYFLGKRKVFHLPIDIKGTDFQKNVWKELQNIPYGKTVSYEDVAINIQNQKAVRAVGTANGKNPLCIIVPCHRVISKNGSMGGYSGGLEIKSKLLEIERIFN
jgi:methylated-DNA-[protein]-cysteine S-methyltransferase